MGSEMCIRDSSETPSASLSRSFSCRKRRTKPPAPNSQRRYSIKLWKAFTDCFNCLPCAAVIDEKIFCCHGGLSPELTRMEQIRNLMRPTDVPDTGLLCDLLWADPDKDQKGWGARQDARRCRRRRSAPSRRCASPGTCLLYTSPSPRDLSTSRMPSSA